MRAHVVVALHDARYYCKQTPLHTSRRITVMDLYVGSVKITHRWDDFRQLDRKMRFFLQNFWTLCLYWWCVNAIYIHCLCVYWVSSRTAYCYFSNSSEWIDIIRAPKFDFLSSRCGKMERWLFSNWFPGRWKRRTIGNWNTIFGNIQCLYSFTYS